jgi:hypothetical protein
MKIFYRYSYVFFILTYVFIAAWLYKGVVGNYDFCLSGSSRENIFALLAGISALLTVPAYINHERLSVKAFDLFTILIGLSAVAIVAYRFFAVLSMCR